MQAKLPSRYIVVHHNGASLPITNHHYTQPCHPNFLFEKNLCRELSVSLQNFTEGQISGKSYSLLSPQYKSRGKQKERAAAVPFICLGPHKMCSCGQRDNKCQPTIHLLIRDIREGGERERGSIAGAKRKMPVSAASRVRAFPR